MSVVEGNQWKQLNRYGPTARNVGTVIDRMYGAGAVRVYIDTGSPPYLIGYVELPSDPTKRNRCEAIAIGCFQSNGLVPPLVAPPATQKYLLVPVTK